MIKTLVNHKNRIPTDYLYEIKDLKVKLGNNSKDLDEISNMILSNQPAKPQLYFKTLVDFSLFDHNFTLPSILFIKNYEANKIFSKIDTKKTYMTIKKPTNNEASIKFITFKDETDLN